MGDLEADLLQRQLVSSAFGRQHRNDYDDFLAGKVRFIGAGSMYAWQFATAHGRHP